MNLFLFLSTLRARFGVFSLVLFMTVAGAIAVSLLMEKTYTATVSLLVDAADEQSMGNSIRPLVNAEQKTSYLATQTDIIASERVARKVVQDLQLAKSPMHDKLTAGAVDNGGSVEGRLAAALLKKLNVETSQSSVIRVSYSSTDPQFSADVANGIAQAYIDTTLELRVEPTRQVAAWFDEQLKTLRARLENAQASLTDYYQRRGIVTADERSDLESTRLAMLSDQAMRAQEQAAQWESRAKQAGESIANSGSLDKLPEILDNQFIQRLKEDLAHGEAKLQELSTRYGPNYPQVQAQVSENRSLRDRLDVEMKKLVAGIETSARQSRQREAGSLDAMTAQKARVLSLKDDRNDLAVLTRNVEAAARSYDIAMQRFLVNQVDSRANQTNVNVLNPAAVPVRHSRPRITLNIALSIVVGTMLGIGVVMLMEMFDRRVRSRADLDLDVPLLAVVNAWHPARLLRGPGGNARALPDAQ